MCVCVCVWSTSGHTESVAMEPGQLIGAIDQGTTSTRFILYDHELKQVALHQTEHQQIYPQAG